MCISVCSTKIDEFVQTKLPQVVILFQECSWDHVKHSLASEHFCLYVPEEDSPEKGKDYECKEDKEYDAQLDEKNTLVEKFGKDISQRVVKAMHLSLIVGVRDY